MSITAAGTIACRAVAATRAVALACAADPKWARARRGFRRALSLKDQPAYKPGSVRRDFSRAAAIPLGRRSLAASSSQPEWRIRRRISVARCHSYSALLPVGFAVPRMLPPARWALTPPFHPYFGEPKRSALCCTFPGVAPAGRYPAPCLRGARTFLRREAAAARPTDGGDVRALVQNVKAQNRNTTNTSTIVIPIGMKKAGSATLRICFESILS